MLTPILTYFVSADYRLVIKKYKPWNNVFFVKAIEFWVLKRFDTKSSTWVNQVIFWVCWHQWLETGLNRRAVGRSENLGG